MTATDGALVGEKPHPHQNPHPHDSQAGVLGADRDTSTARNGGAIARQAIISPDSAADFSDAGESVSCGAKHFRGAAKEASGVGPTTSCVGRLCRGVAGDAAGFEQSVFGTGKQFQGSEKGPFWVGTGTCDGGKDVSRLRKPAALMTTWWDICTHVKAWMQSISSPLAFHSEELEAEFTAHQDNAAHLVCHRFHAMAMLVDMLLAVLVWNDGMAGITGDVPLMLFLASLVVLAYAGCYPHLFCKRWRGAMVFFVTVSYIWSARLVAHTQEAMRGRDGLTFGRKESPFGMVKEVMMLSLAGNHMFHMLGLPLPLHIHVPLYTMCQMYLMANNIGVCRRSVHVRRMTYPLADLVLGRVTPFVWDLITMGHPLRPELDMLWPVGPAPVSLRDVWRAQAASTSLPPHSSAAPPQWEAPTSHGYCAAVLSGASLGALVVGTFLVSCMEVAQRREFLRLRTPHVPGIGEWPWGSLQFGMNLVVNTVGRLGLLWFVIWYSYIILLAGMIESGQTNTA